MPVNTIFLGSGQTQRFTGSDVSIDANLAVTGTLSVTGAQTFTGALTGSSLSLTGAAAGTNAKFSTLGLGGSATSLIFASGSSTTIVATTVAATSSTTTSLANNNVQAGDIILVGPSNLSKGVHLQAYASAASTIIFSYSNASTDAAAQVAINCRYVILRSNG